MRVLLVLVILLGSIAAGRAADSPDREEIAFLLGYVERSNVRFLRGGKEYSNQEAADHLRRKLKSAGTRVKNADDFIVGIASKSYLTGGTYLVKLSDGKIVPTGSWLTQALVEYRASASASKNR